MNIEVELNIAHLNEGTWFCASVAPWYVLGKKLRGKPMWLLEGKGEIEKFPTNAQAIYCLQRIKALEEKQDGAFMDFNAKINEEFAKHFGSRR